MTATCTNMLQASDSATTVILDTTDELSSTYIRAYATEHAYRQGECLGHISYDLNNGQIEALEVQPASQRRGLGTQLFRAALKDLKNRGEKNDVRWLSTPGAIPFYEKQGARITCYDCGGYAHMIINIGMKS